MKEQARDLLEEIRPYFEDERIKFILGPRYAGKSAFLSQIAKALEGKKVPANHILRIDFAEESFAKIRGLRSFIDYLKSKIRDGRKYYVLLDQVNECEDLFGILKSLNRSFYCSVFVTSDDVRFLEEEISALRPSSYIRFFLGPISFLEYLAVLPKPKTRESLLACFEDYAFADVAYFFEGEEIRPSRGFLRKFLFGEIYKRHPNLPFSSFYEACQRIILHAGEDFSPSSISKELKKRGLSLEPSTVLRYAEMLEENALIDHLEPYSEDGRTYSRGNRRFFPLFHQLLNYPNPADRRKLAKTLVYLYLKGQGYDLNYGKTYAGTFDLVVRKDDKMCLLAVSDYLEGDEEKKKKIYSSFRPMKTSCPRFVVSFDEGDCSFLGIKNLNLVDFLMGKAPLFLT